MNASSKPRLLSLIITAAVLLINPLHAQVTTPGLFKALKGQKDKGLQAKVAMSAKQIGLSLFTFHADWNKLPGEATIKSVAETADDGVKVAAESANDCFFQLIVGGYIQDPGIFSPERKDARRDVAGIKKLEHCFFSYIPANDFDRADRPLVVAPLMKGKKVFDPKPLGGKAVVMLSDISVHILDIDENGVVKLDGKDIFDPKQPYWQGNEPVVKWPEH